MYKHQKRLAISGPKRIQLVKPVCVTLEGKVQLRSEERRLMKTTSSTTWIGNIEHWKRAVARLARRRAEPRAAKGDNSPEKLPRTDGRICFYKETVDGCQSWAPKTILGALSCPHRIFAQSNSLARFPLAEYNAMILDEFAVVVVGSERRRQTVAAGDRSPTLAAEYRELFSSARQYFKKRG